MSADERHDPEERLEPMDEARCLFVLSLLMDERPVEAELERAARAWAESHPECERALAEWRLQARALAEQPALTARPEFTERVLAAAARAGQLARPAEALAGQPAGDRLEAQGLRPFARQLALAAGLALMLSLVIVLARPSDLRADAGIARHRHAVDGFRSQPFGPDDIEAGLRARLADAEFGARRGGSRP